MKFDHLKMIEGLRRVVQRMHYPLGVMLVCVRWYAGYPLSFRQIEDLYRAVDNGVGTIDFLLRAKRAHAAARTFFERAIDLHEAPEKITIDKSGANAAAIVSIQADRGVSIELRQSKPLNNIVEQDHQAVKLITQPMLGFKSFRCARILIADSETVQMIRKGQLGNIKGQDSSAANEFYSLAC